MWTRDTVNASEKRALFSTSLGFTRSLPSERRNQSVPYTGRQMPTRLVTRRHKILRSICYRLDSLHAEKPLILSIGRACYSFRQSVCLGALGIWSANLVTSADVRTASALLKYCAIVVVCSCNVAVMASNIEYDFEERSRSKR